MMELILREDVFNLGSTGDVVKVKPGYGRNYLLPRGLAVVADRRSVGALAHQQRLVAEKRERDRSDAEALAARISAVTARFQSRAGEGGKLFGSVTNLDLERALAEHGIEIDRRRIRLDEPIKSLGEHKVVVRLSVGVEAPFTVIVDAEGDAPAAAPASEN
jgi:large subunit ribosomal protein L9